MFIVLSALVRSADVKGRQYSSSRVSGVCVDSKRCACSWAQAPISCLCFWFMAVSFGELIVGFGKDGSVFSVVCSFVACGWIYEGDVCSIFCFCVESVVEGLPKLFAISGVHPGCFSLDSVVFFLC